MKKALIIQVGLISLIIFSHTTTHAQDYTQLHLPEGAKMRFGKGEIHDIKFSPNGSMFAVASSIGILLYDVQSKKPVRFLQSDHDPIYTISFVNDGKIILGAAEFGKIYVWDIHTIKDPNSVNIGKQHNWIQGIGYIWSSAITNDGNTLAVGTGIGSITLWNIQSGQQIASMKAHKESVNSLAFSTDGKTLASSGEDYKIHLWDVPTQERRYTLPESFNAQTLAFTSDGKSLVGGSFSGFVQTWNLETRQKTISFNGHRDRIRAVAYSPDNKIVASGSWDSTVRLWNASTGAQIGIIYGYPFSVERMGFAPNGNTVAGTARGIISLWDINTRSEKPAIVKKQSGLFWGMAFSPDSKDLLFADVGFNLYVYNVNTAIEKETKKFKKHKGGYYSIAFSSDRTIVANGYTNKKIRLWDINSEKELLSISTKFKEAIITLAFSPDGNSIAGAGKDGIIKIWDTKKGALLSVLQGHSDRIESIVFSPNGKLLASGSWDGTMRLWNIEEKTQITQQEGNRGAVIEVLFSSDGNIVVGTDTGNTIQLWDLNNLNNRPGVILPGHNGWIRSLEFSADGKTLASGSDDGTILIWDWDKLTQMLNTNNPKYRDN